MKYFELTKDEKRLVGDFEKGKLVRVKNASKLKRAYLQYAKNTLQKSKNINIRLSGKDLLKIRSRAVQEGIPYQTLVASVLHRYAANV